jgi:membrane-bound inhibitor of C-type lysozyme
MAVHTKSSSQIISRSRALVVRYFPAHAASGGKYAGSFNTHSEWVAFVKGAKAVLYMLRRKPGQKSVLNDMLEAK